MKTQVISILFAGISIIVTGLAGAITKEVISLAKAKKAEIVKKLGSKEYNELRETAIGVYHEIEGNFIGLHGVGPEKILAFETSISKLIPGITPDMIDHLRQSVWGEINKDIKESDVLEPCPYVEADEPEPQEEKSLTDYSKEDLIKMIQDMKQPTQTIAEQSILNTPSIT